jgi:hypothetical protein
MAVAIPQSAGSQLLFDLFSGFPVAPVDQTLLFVMVVVVVVVWCGCLLGHCRCRHHPTVAVSLWFVQQPLFQRGCVLPLRHSTVASLWFPYRPFFRRGVV